MQDRFIRNSLHKRNFNQKMQFRVVLAVGSISAAGLVSTCLHRGTCVLANPGAFAPWQSRGNVEQGLEGSGEGATLSSHHDVPVKFFTCKIPKDPVNDERQKKAARGRGCAGGCFPRPCSPARWEGEAIVGR